LTQTTFQDKYSEFLLFYYSQSQLSIFASSGVENYEKSKIFASQQLPTSRGEVQEKIELF